MGNIDCSFKVIDLGMAIHTSANELGDPRYVNKTRCAMISGHHANAIKIRACFLHAVDVLSSSSTNVFWKQVMAADDGGSLPDVATPSPPPKCLMCQGPYKSRAPPRSHVPNRRSLGAAARHLDDRLHVPPAPCRETHGLRQLRLADQTKDCYVCNSRRCPWDA